MRQLWPPSTSPVFAWLAQVAWLTASASIVVASLSLTLISLACSGMALDPNLQLVAFFSLIATGALMAFATFISHSHLVALISPTAPARRHARTELLQRLDPLLI